jgi:AraC family transcriptional regulator of adaptative response / DNA-3-methyladenine glycosylase II
MDQRIFEQALKARDPRFDGRFFIGVRTTGIYCRPVCPVKSPRLANVRFFPTAAAAAEAGFRPCLRCRPESSPGTPAWAGTSATVQRALRLIGEGALDEGGVEALSDRLGVTSRHLSRLFMRHLGAPPVAIAQTRRLHFAKKLLNETDLSMTEIALSAGYGSVRRFNDHVRHVYGRPPSAARRKTRCGAHAAAPLPPAL